MAMSRKDYIKVAKVTKSYNQSFIRFDDYIDFVNDLCVIFEEDNDRFDSDRFKKATGVLA